MELKEAFSADAPPSLLDGIKHGQSAVKSLVSGINRVNWFRANFAQKAVEYVDNWYMSSSKPCLSSVLVVLRFNERSDEQLGCWDVLLTLRTTSLNLHRGVVCFPGGKMEENEDPVDCALREASEEVGLHADDVETLGVFEPTVSYYNSKTYTVISVVKNNDINICINPSEVQDFFWMPLTESLRAENHRSADIPHVSLMPLHYFDYRPRGTKHVYTIWGLTAQLLMVTAGASYHTLPEYIDLRQQPIINDPLVLGYIPAKL